MKKAHCVKEKGKLRVRKQTDKITKNNRTI